MQDCDAASLSLRLACPGGGVISFGPLTRDASAESFDFIVGPIQVADQEGEVFTLVDRNGIESLALDNFRGDLLLMLANEHGVIYFGDHDFSQIVELEVVGPGVVEADEGGVIETVEREDIFEVLEEILYVAKQPSLVDEVDTWRNW